MKRILFVDHTPFVGGAQLILVDHIRNLDRSHFEVFAACTHEVPFLVEQLGEAGAKVSRLPMGRLRSRSPIVLARLMSAAIHLRRLIRREKIDLVVSTTSRAAYVASLAVLGTRVILVWRVMDFFYGRPLFRFLSRIPRRIVCVSESIRSFYGGGSDEKFKVIYVGSSLYEQLDEVTDLEIEAERARWGIAPGDVVVGFIGRVVSDKGPEDVVEAVKILHPRNANVRCLIVGSGRGQEGDVEEDLRRRIEAERLPYIIMTGHQSRHALYYRMIDIFVLSTRNDEPYATAVVQAMMAGVPVVATATGGTPELVRHHETGLLVPPAQPEAIADALALYLDEPDFARQVAGRARDAIMAGNREDAITAAYERLYADVLSERGASAPAKRSR